jgi:N-acetyl-1-D-myo-inositol-2-amino-2-deoxy-alpha-D-glucopyranoside deacetylase
MKTLGVTDHRFLGGPGRYRDSGMAWDESGHATAADTVRDDTFWRADLLEAATMLVEIVREVRPQVLVTYDDFGEYGHPDHVQAHRVATYAVALAAVPSFRPELGHAWDVAKVYWVARSASQYREGTKVMAEAGIENPFQHWDPDRLPRFFHEDEAIAACVDASDYADTKLDALRAHATQVAVDGPFFALSNQLGSAVWGVEFFRIAKGRKGPTDERGWESDLFAGL